MGLNIDTHDLETKVGQTVKFLKQGNKVKVAVRFRGREMAHKELGVSLIEKFQELCAEYGVADKPAKMEGRSLVVILNAKTNK